MDFNGIYHLNLAMEPEDEQCLEKGGPPTPCRRVYVGWGMLGE